MRICTFAILCLTVCATGQNIYVNDDAPLNGDGSAPFPFRTIAEALNATNSMSGRPTIQVAPGDYYVDTTLRIERPVILQGSTALRNGPGGLPSETARNGTATRILGTAALTSLNPILLVGAPGQVITGVEIRDLMFIGQANIGGLLETHRVQELAVSGNLFSGTAATPGISTFASSGEIRGNYFTGLLAGALLAAGYGGSPAELDFHDNRITGNSNGLLLVGTSDGILEAGDHLAIDVHANDVSGNSGTGIRILVEGNERLAGHGANPGYQGYVFSQIHNNEIKSNGRGLVVDAGFPYRVTTTPLVCDTRPFTGMVDLTIRDNAVADNANPPTITFTRQQVLNNSTLRAQFKYLQSAVYRITDPAQVFSPATATIDNPGTDPYTGSVCPTGSESLNNMLVINGISIP